MDEERDDKLAQVRPKLVEAKQRWAREGRLLTGGRGARPQSERLPPGQHLVQNWPVLDLGIVPEVATKDWRLRIDGWVAPAVRAAVELRTGAGTHRADTDDDGRFVLTSVPRGLAQLVLRPEDPDLLTVVTPSIEL